MQESSKKYRISEDEISSKLIDNKQLVSKIARSYFLLGADSDDIMQEGMIGLFNAITTFDSSQNICSFKTYATKCVKRQILDAIKKSNRYKNQPLNEYFEISRDGKVIFNSKNSMDDSGEEKGIFLPSIALSPEEEFFSTIRMKEIVSTIETVLSKLEKLVLQDFIDGLSITEIASKNDMSNKAVSNALSRIKTKLSFLNE